MPSALSAGKQVGRLINDETAHAGPVLANTISWRLRMVPYYT